MGDEVTEGDPQGEWDPLGVCSILHCSSASFSI